MNTQLGYPLYMDGKEVHGPVTFHHGPTPPMPIQGTGEYFSEPMSGIGQTMMPRLPAYQKPGGWFAKAAAVSPLMGALGQAADAAAEKVSADQTGNQKAAMTATVALALVGVGLVVRGAAGYFAGKAMAPSKADEDKYAWGGVAASVLLGALGLGVEGAIALRARKE